GPPAAPMPAPSWPGCRWATPSGWPCSGAGTTARSSALCWRSSSRRPLELDGLAVLPLAEDEVAALEGGVVVVAEAHRRAFVAGGGGQTLDLLEPFLHALAGDVYGASEAFDDEAADVVGGHPDGAGGRLR